MDVENIFYPLALAALALISLIGMLNFRLFYTDSSRLPFKPPAWWPYSAKGWRKWAGVMPISPILALTGSIAGFLVEYGDLTSSVVKNLFLLFALLTFAGFLFGLFVVITGRPKWVVPQHLRRDTSS